MEDNTLALPVLIEILGEQLPNKEIKLLSLTGQTRQYTKQKLNSKINKTSFEKTYLFEKTTVKRNTP